MDSKTPRQAYIVLLGGLLLNLLLGVLYSWSIFSKALVEQWNWSSAQSTLPYAIAIGFFTAGVVIAGRLQDRLGPRIVAMAGGLMAGLGILTASFATIERSLPVILGFGILGGLGIGFGYAAATPPAVKWFGAERKGLVTGIVVSGFVLASIYIAPLTTSLINHYGIASTFRILGIAFTVIATACGFLLQDPPAAPQESAHTALPLDQSADTSSFSAIEMLRTPRFYHMWLAYACAAFAGLMIIGVMAKVAVLQIPGMNFGFLLVATLAIGNASGRLGAGVLLDRIGPRNTMLIMFIGQAIAMAGLGSVHSFALLIGVVVAIGAFYGANLALFPALTADHFGTRTLGTNYGILFTAYGAGGIFGSLIAGKLFDATGSFQPAFFVASALCVVATLLAPLAAKRYTKTDRARQTSIIHIGRNSEEVL